MELRDQLSDLARTLNVGSARQAGSSDSGRIDIRPSYDRAKRVLEVEYSGSLHEGAIMGTLVAVLDRNDSALSESLTAYVPGRGNRSFAGNLERNDMGSYSGQEVQVVVAVAKEGGGLIGEVVGYKIP